MDDLEERNLDRDEKRYFQAEALAPNRQRHLRPTVRPPAKRNWQRLLWWMEERQRIYLAKEQGLPQPWTKDPVLGRYRFCNVYREQDRTTTWLRQNWRTPFAEHPNLWFAMCLARQINYIDTLAQIGFPRRWLPARAMAVMRARQRAGLKVYTSAYMLTAPTAGRVYHGNKANYTIYGVLHNLWTITRRAPPPWNQADQRCGEVTLTLEHACTYLRQFMGFGPFLAYEVVTDLRHTRYLCNAPDIYTWANSGPGCRRGLNRLYGRPTDERRPQASLLAEMRLLLPLLTDQRDKFLLPALELRDVEHSLCEFDKWSRVRENSRCGLERYIPYDPEAERNRGRLV